MFPLSLIICETFAKLIKCQKFVIENEGQSHGGEKLDLHRSSKTIRWDIVDFFKEFEQLWNMRLRLRFTTYTHTHTHTHTARDGSDDYRQNLQNKCAVLRKSFNDHF